MAKERPADPVQFVADFLLRKHDELKKEQETTTTEGAAGEGAKPSSGGEVREYSTTKKQALTLYIL